MNPLSVSSILADALRVYRLLFRRSVVTAAIVYAAVATLDGLSDAKLSTDWHRLALIAAAVAQLAGPVLVQGALVEIVRNIHEGRAPAPIGELYGSAASRFWRLLGASLFYGFAVTAGLLLFVVPGLVIAARWSLMVPAIVLERRKVFESLDESRRVIREGGHVDHTWTAAGAIVVTYLITNIAFFAIAVSDLDLVWSTVAVFAWNALTAPFAAHVLTVLYYRLVDPNRPVIHPAVRGWRSVWAGA